MKRVQKFMFVNQGAVGTVATIAIASLLLFLLACGNSQTPVSVSIKPANSSLLVNQSTQFTATVTGTSNSAVTWSVSEPQGGTVRAGLYNAPWANGTFHVIATSVADPSQTATAEIAVSARFAFIEKLPNGTSLPWSVTPNLGTLGADGKFATTNISDPGTAKPWIRLSLTFFSLAMARKPSSRCSRIVPMVVTTQRTSTRQTPTARG